MNIDLERLATLSRIKLTDDEKGKFEGDLGKILAHFKELEKLDTSSVVPMTGGTNMENVFREDFSIGQTDSSKLLNQFPDTKDGLLRVPGVFE